MPATGLPVALSLTVPEIVAQSDVAQSDGSEKSSTGFTPSLVDAAKYPMPRSAKIDHSAVSFAPPKFTRSAWMIAFRMSRYEGAGGDSSMPRVTSVSVDDRAERLTDLPERLQPDLAVGVHFGAAGHLAEVAVRVAAGAGALGAAAWSGRADRAVDRLGADIPSNEIAPITTSPTAAVSGLNPWLFRKSSAYQSLHPSPIELPCWLVRPDVPSG